MVTSKKQHVKPKGKWKEELEAINALVKERKITWNKGECEKRS